MKVFMRIYKWILLSVILQFLVLLFFNNVYLARRGGPAKVVSIEKTGSGTAAKPVEEVKVKIPSDAKQIKISYDALYAAYIKDGKLEIFDMKNKKIKKTLNFGNGDLTYYRWLPDRDMVIYATRSDNGQYGTVQVATHDVGSGVERSYPKMSKLPKRSEVVDIELSTLTNVVYVKVKTSNSQASVYKYNIMDNLSFVMGISLNSVIKEAKYVDKLVYQNDKNKLFVRDGIKNVSWPFPFKNKMVLLGLDSEDKVFAGELNKDNKVAKIHYGKLTVEPDKAWMQISLKKPVLPEDIRIMSDGTVYEVLKAENAVRNVRTDNKIDYKGDFIEIANGYIVTIDDGELRLTAVKEKEGK